MKKLIVICFTALVIVFFHESGKSFQEQIRAEAQMRAQMFKSYADHHRGGNRQSGSDPTVEIPTEPKLQKEKL